MRRFPGRRDRVEGHIHAWQWAACLLAGIALLPLLREPLATPAKLGLVLAAALLLWRRDLRCLSFLPLGLCMASIAATHGAAQKLDPAQVGVDLDLPVRVVDFPERRDGLVRLLVEPVSAGLGVKRMRLNWYDAEHQPRIGDCWTLTVRLRRPRGWSNPHAFDYEKWLFLRRVGATGYVKNGAPDKHCAPVGGILELRRRVADRLTSLLPPDAASAVLLAITIGARHRIDTEQWQQYARTGTSHLMAISGMHIGLAAGTAYLAAWWLSAALRRRGNHRLLASAISLLVAAMYVSLAGFAIPARRAFVMLLLAVLALLWRRPVTVLQVVSLTLIGLALASPLDVLSSSFQLSFAAVLVLWLQSRRQSAGTAQASVRRPWQAARQLAVLQVGLLLGMLPLTGLLFDRAAWLAPAVNLAVLPLFNLVAVPAALAGVLLDGLCEPAGDALLKTAWRSVHGILAIVQRAAELPRADLPLPSPAGFGTALLLLPGLWVLLPVSWPGRRLAWVAAAAAILYQPPRPPTGCLDLHVLDVGQGLASVLVTARHVAVFDTGPAFRSGANAARLVISPFLRSIGVRRIDLLVVSHADLDHAGGAAALQAEWPIEAALNGEALPLVGVPQWRCQAGQVWHWDGMRFRVLYPATTDQAGNNASCVLEVGGAAARLLLTGDIEAGAERRMLAAGVVDPATVVQIPHHGSGTSSSPNFVAALRADVAIASAGYGNRWGMPRDEIVARWQDAGASVYNTADDGAISVRLCANGDLTALETARRKHRKVWHEYG